MTAAPSTLDRILADDGPIARALIASGVPFEHRPEQGIMARAAMDAMESRSRLLAEAGTGVGKSFAYLVPAILRAVLHNETVVVTTATISLQEQLIQKDIPLLQRTLEQWDLGPAARALVPVLAKGRGNYLSVRRLKVASEREDSILYDAESKTSLHVIQDWAYATKDGTLSTLPALERPEVWDHVRSDTDNCMGRKCPTYQKCFYQVARRELEKANLIVCNHALFFADLAMRQRPSGGGGAILPPYDQVILDEAHNVEDAACEHFGLSLAQPRVSRLLRTLFSPRRGKGYLMERQMQLATGAGGSDAVDRAVHLVIHAEDASRRFFDALLEYAQRNRANSGRIVRPDVIENELTPAMRDVAVRLRNLRESIENEQDRFELQSYARRAAEVADSAEALVAQTMQGYVYWVEVEDRGATTGRGRGFGPRVELACAPVEVAPILRRVLFDPSVEVQAVPLDEGGEQDEVYEHDAESGFVHEEVDESAWHEHDASDNPFNHEPDADDSPHAAPSAPAAQPGPGTAPPSGKPRKPLGIVLTSATLATRTAGPDEQVERAETAFAHAIQNLGLPPPPDTKLLQLGSPFDYSRQATLYIDLSLPNPKSGDVSRGGPNTQTAQPASSDSGKSYLDALAARVLHHVKATDGGAFVLFTSFATLNAVADRIKRELDRLDIVLLAQGRDGPRTLVLKKFIEADRAVLLGAATFWQGVDVRGERLRNVIITRLPFEPPDRPLTQARMERIENQGGNSFAQDSLPRAIIRFKQGFGRLIRSKSDRGRVVILDPRIKTARYGRMFLNALPEGVRMEEVRAEADEWF